MHILIEDRQKTIFTEQGLDSAIKCTQAFFSNDIKYLNALTVDEAKSIFKAANINYLTHENGK
jgi:hypothetical protein